MRWYSAVRHITALLSFSFLTILASLVATTFIFGLLFQWTPNVIMSGSMEPLVKTGDIAIARPLTTEEVKTKLKEGHVLLADNPAKPGHLITHRIIEVKRNGDDKALEFITKGDANEKADSTPIPVQNVKAVQQILVPKIGLPVQGIRTGNFIPVIIFIGLLAATWISAKKEWAIAELDAQQRKEAKELKKSGKAPKKQNTVQQQLATRTSIRKAKTRKSRLGIYKIIAFFIILSIAAGSFLLSNASARFSDTTTNASCTFRTGTWKAASTTGCWSGNYASENYAITMNNAPGAMGFTGNLNLSLNTSGRDFAWTFSAASGSAVDATYTAVLTAKNPAGATVVSTANFSGTKVATGATSANFDNTGQQLNYTIEIKKQGMNTPVVWSGSLVLNKCFSYSQGRDASQYCWSNGATPQGVNLNLPLTRTSTAYVNTEASVTINYDADMLGFTWKAIFPETKTLSANETFRVNAANTDGQNSTVISKPLTSRILTGHVGIPTSKNVTFIGELFIGATKTHSSAMPITACTPATDNNTVGYNPATYCSTSPSGVVASNFATPLVDATTAGRAPLNIISKVTYNLSLNNTNVVLTFPAGTLPSGARMTVTNAAGGTITSTAGTINTAQNTITLSATISVAGPQVTFTINTTDSRGRADRRVTFIVKQCASS